MTKTSQMEKNEKKVRKINRVPLKKEIATRRKLGELLIETGLLSPGKLKEALEVQKESDKRLGQILIDMKLISEEEIAFAVAMQLKIPYVDLSNYEIPEKIKDSIPEEVARKFVCVPI